MRGEVAHRGAVVGVGPEVLWGARALEMLGEWRGVCVKECMGIRRTRTEYWRPARIQGDSVRLKNRSAGSSRVLI